MKLLLKNATLIHEKSPFQNQKKDVLVVDGLGACPDAGEYQGHRGHEDDEDRGCIRDPEPDDGEHGPNGRRHGIQCGQNRIEDAR